MQSIEVTTVTLDGDLNEEAAWILSKDRPLLCEAAVHVPFGPIKLVGYD